MLRFSNPQYLWLLLLVPFLTLLYAACCASANKKLRRVGNLRLLRPLMLRRSAFRPHLKFCFLMLAVALLAVVIARPQYGMKQQSISTKGIEAVVMVDVSNSMLATDVQPSRLERAKLLISNLIDRMKNDKVAMGVFAGEAYPQLPITSDYASAKVFVDALSPNMVTLQGTNISAAIDLAENSFTSNKRVGKAIILITDGEDHQEGAKEAAADAAKKGFQVYVIGVGTAEGGTIPTVNGLLQDANGQTVRTSLNEQMCREIAQAGKGLYLHLDQTSSAQEELQSQLASLKQDTTTTQVSARNEQFQAVALLLLVVLIIECCISETQNARLKRFKIFKS